MASGSSFEDEDSFSETDSEVDAPRKKQLADSDDDDALEATYRPRRPSPKSSTLPVILSDGTVQPLIEVPDSRVLQPDFPSDEDEQDTEELQQPMTEPVRSDPYGPRFGRPGVQNILQLQDKAVRIEKAKYELASLSRDIMADPENSLNLLKRLLSFCQTTFKLNKHDKNALPVDQPVRALAILSMLAVLLDVVPHYRIRDLTEKEKDNKVSQAVLRQRDYEDGLVGTYKRYIEICEKEIKASSPLRAIAIKCLCDLLTEKSQFNLATHIMEVIVYDLGQVEWDQSSKACVDCIVAVFINDQAGSDALHLVRLLSRMVKTKSYRVNPAIFTAFLSLQLTVENGVRASGDGASKEQDRQSQKWLKKGNRKPANHINKKQRKAIKSRKEVEKEYEEAEMVVSVEERQRERTETLKILFALYFRILKLDQSTPLLAPTLEGLARYAHLINVDFFRDILACLRKHIKMEDNAQQLDVRHRLLCVVTAFDILSGQGEALNIDLSDFIQDLYAVLLSLSSSDTFETDPRPDRSGSGSGGYRQSHLASEADLLFSTLHKVFITARTTHPFNRVAAFAKRLLVCSLSWPNKSACRALKLVRSFIVKHPALESLLTTDDLRLDGQYKADAVDLTLSNAHTALWYELGLLESNHVDADVRTAAADVAQCTRTN